MGTGMGMEMEEEIYKYASHFIPCHLYLRKNKMTPSTAYVIMYNYICATMYNDLLSPKKVENPLKIFKMNLY